jgi:hypothetical protein
MALIIKEGPVQTQEAEAFLVVSNSLQLNDKAEGGVCLSWEYPSPQVFLISKDDCIDYK